MSPEEFAARMRGIQTIGDVEARHGHADSLLVDALWDLGYGEGCDVYEDMEKWYA